MSWSCCKDEEIDEKDYTHKEVYFEDVSRNAFLRNVRAIFDANPEWAVPRISYVEATKTLELATHEDCAKKVFRRASKLLGKKAQAFHYG